MVHAFPYAAGVFVHKRIPACLVASAVRRLERVLRPVFLLAALVTSTFGANATELGIGSGPACSPKQAVANFLWVSADFDGDRKVDQARVRVQRDSHGLTAFALDLVQCRPSTLQLVSSLASGELVLRARDVDGDADQDLVVAGWRDGRTRSVWINDGEGTFSEAAPADFPFAGRHIPHLAGVYSQPRPSAALSPSRIRLSVLRIVDPDLHSPDSLQSVDGYSLIVSSDPVRSKPGRAPPLLCC